jgi:menaquinone-dependent protoporphyrinogen oxidase
MLTTRRNPLEGDTMKVLVTAASKHGSTHEIGEAIAMQIQALGIPAEFCDLDAPMRHIDASAVVLGSPIYMGKWLPEAREFAEKHRSQLKSLPVWLFSSGPLGDGHEVPTDPPEKIDELCAEIDAREHRIFGGRLNSDALGLGEKVLTRVIGAPEGDYREWSEIHAWARDIGETLLGR